MRQPSFKPSEKDKEKSVDDIFYELQMLLDCRVLHENAIQEFHNAKTEQTKARWSVTQNAILESFLLHYRSLADFLNNEKYGTDVKARDYSPAWKPDPALNDPVEAARVNKKLAHLTYDRATSRRGWKLEDLESRICKVFGAFLNSLKEDYYPWFASCRSKLSVYGY